MSAAEFQRLRKAKGYTQAELAKLLRVNLRTIGRWERGERTVPHIAIMAMQGLKRRKR